MTSLIDVLLLPYTAPAPDFALPAGVGRLAESGNEAARRIAEAITEVVDNRLDGAEKAYIERIEARRAALEASSEVISYMDYGASTRESRETAEDMYRGSPRERTVGNLCERTSKRYRSALFLFKLVRKFRPRTCLEMGSCLGISAAYQAAALELNGAGRIVTLEGAAPVAALARETFESVGLENVDLRVGRFQDILDDVLRECAPFEYAFIDGHHDGDATVDYFHRVLPFLAADALVIFDDIRWSEGMTRAWRRVLEHPKVTVSVDLVDIGVCALSAGAGAGERFDLS